MRKLNLFKRKEPSKKAEPEDGGWGEVAPEPQKKATLPKMTLRRSNWSSKPKPSFGLKQVLAFVLAMMYGLTTVKVVMSIRDFPSDLNPLLLLLPTILILFDYINVGRKIKRQELQQKE